MRNEIKTPAPEEIYLHKCLYQQHKRKLGQIRAERKSYFGFQNDKIHQFQHFKESKTKSFINKFNKTNTNIDKQNMRFLGKLKDVKPSVRASVSEERQRNSLSFITPFTRKRILETQKQNVRISNRMRNLSSSLNPKNFIKDYAKSQQIKNRIMRYTGEEGKVYLKSNRYFNSDTSSLRSEKRNASERKSLAAHYKKQDIMKNRVQGNITRRKLKGRPNTSLDVQKEDDSFFTTEPKRQKVKRKVLV